MKLLIVNGNAAEQAQLSQWLSHLKDEVLTTKTAEAALELLTVHSIGVVLLSTKVEGMGLRAFLSACCECSATTRVILIGPITMPDIKFALQGAAVSLAQYYLPADHTKVELLVAVAQAKGLYQRRPALPV